MVWACNWEGNWDGFSISVLWNYPSPGPLLEFFKEGGDRKVLLSWDFHDLRWHSLNLVGVKADSPWSLYIFVTDSLAIYLWVPWRHLIPGNFFHLKFRKCKGTDLSPNWPALPLQPSDFCVCWFPPASFYQGKLASSRELSWPWFS